MPELRILRGVPGSGKSTYANDLVGFTKINRDSIRFQMFGRYWGVDEDVVTQVENTMLAASLRAGHDVVLDATNLAARHVRSKLSIAHRWGAEVTFVDFPVPLEEAVARDSARERQVGRQVITGFFTRFRVNRETGALPDPPPLLPTFEPYVGNPNLPAAYIVDTDGTVANHEPHRGPHDTSRYAEDTVHEHVANVVIALHNQGIPIIGVSGRDAAFREVTETWWTDNGIPFDEFYFRPEGDRRIDSVIKYELFRANIADRFNVVAAFDDRPQVIRMWETIGVPVFNVADGTEF